MDAIAPQPYGEIRISEEDERLRNLSESTLRFMHDHGVLLEERLREQSRYLGFLVEEEYDLVNAMRLSERRASVGRNVRVAGRRVETIRAEIVRRSVESP
ncbi:MAG: hypothetical protein GF405_06590 [Candidatus Eisenbacteria bacterium]|nr:hypothetical protein [Candidatus Eisenbacteria bacterium]